jgi:hypothetical protein
MKNFLLSAAILGGFISANAQGVWVEDSVVVGNQYKNRVYYSLANGETGTTFPDYDKVDFIAHASAFSSNLRINGGFSAQLYHYAAGDTSAWATLDTTGLKASNGWERVMDDDTDLLGLSAFEKGSDPDYGWGAYNQVTHIISGSRLFVYRKGTTWKKVWIVDKVSGTYNIKLANLDGSNETTIAMPVAVTDKNFIYYSISENETYNVEPNSNTYDIVFTKYEGLSNGGQPGVTPTASAVSGVNNNFVVLPSSPGQPLNVNYVEVQRVATADPEVAVFDGNALTEDFNSIGDKWKGLNMQTFQYEIVANNSYFIKDLPGNIWQLAFTKFYTGTGANIGKYVFKKRRIASVSIEENNETISAWNVFPNPAADFVSVVFDSKVADNATFNLLDLNGRTVMSENFSANTGLNQYSVDLASKNLPAGIYVATLRAGNVLKTTKLIVQ